MFELKRTDINEKEAGIGPCINLQKRSCHEGSGRLGVKMRMKKRNRKRELGQVLLDERFRLPARTILVVRMVFHVNGPATKLCFFFSKNRPRLCVFSVFFNRTTQFFRTN